MPKLRIIARQKGNAHNKTSVTKPYKPEGISGRLRQVIRKSYGLNDDGWLLPHAVEGGLHGACSLAELFDFAIAFPVS